MTSNKDKVSQIMDMVVEEYDLRDNIMAMQGVTMINSWLETEDDDELGDMLSKIQKILNS